MRNVIVIGGSGFLGRAIIPLIPSPHRILATHCHRPRDASSVRYVFPHDRLADIVERHSADMVVFAAEIERNQGVDDPTRLTKALRKALQPISGVRLLYVSSDAVFSGRRGLYAEHDEPRPTTTYGRNLLACETVIQDVCRDWCIVRPSYLYGYSQGVLDARLQDTLELCRRGETVSYYKDMFKSPIHVCDAARLIMHLAFSNHKGIVHMGGPRMSVFDFHVQGLSALGMPPRLKADSLPVDSGLLRDTSLDSSLCSKLTGYAPTPVRGSFERYGIPPSVAGEPVGISEIVE